MQDVALYWGPPSRPRGSFLLGLCFITCADVLVNRNHLILTDTSVGIEQGSKLIELLGGEIVKKGFLKLPDLKTFELQLFPSRNMNQVLPLYHY